MERAQLALKSRGAVYQCSRCNYRGDRRQMTSHVPKNHEAAQGVSYREARGPFRIQKDDAVALSSEASLKHYRQRLRPDSRMRSDPEPELWEGLHLDLDAGLPWMVSPLPDEDEPNVVDGCQLDYDEAGLIDGQDATASSPQPDVDKTDTVSPVPATTVCAIVDRTVEGMVWFIRHPGQDTPCLSSPWNSARRTNEHQRRREQDGCPPYGCNRPAREEPRELCWCR